MANETITATCAAPDISLVEIDGNMPIVRFLRALAVEGLTLKHNCETNKLRVVESAHKGTCAKSAALGALRA